MDFEKFNPNEAFYHTSISVIDKLLKIGKFCGYVDVRGLDYINEKDYLIFAANHQSFLDIVVLEAILMQYSTNKKVIPAPTYRGFFQGVKKKWVAPILVWYGGFPIYPKKEGDLQKKHSIEEAVNCLLKQDRLIIFPEGKRNMDGKVGKGRLGVVDIAIGAYNNIHEHETNRNIAIIPTHITYKPRPGIPVLHTKKITIQFGDPWLFKKEEICNLTEKEPCSLKGEEENCLHCRSNMADAIMEKTHGLTIVNTEQLASYFLIEATRAKKPFTPEQMKESVEKMKEHLKGKNIRLDNTLEQFLDKRIEQFITKLNVEGLLERAGEKYQGSKELLNIPECKETKKQNVFLYYRNSIDHLLLDFEYFKNGNP